MYCNVRALVAHTILHMGLYRNSLPDHLLLEAKHTFEIRAFIVVLFAGLRVMRIRVMAVEKLSDMETGSSRLFSAYGGKTDMCTGILCHCGTEDVPPDLQQSLLGRYRTPADCH